MSKKRKTIVDVVVDEKREEPIVEVEVVARRPTPTPEARIEVPERTDEEKVEAVEMANAIQETPTRTPVGGAKVRFCRVVLRVSMVMTFPHEKYCAVAGKCFCMLMGGGGRALKTVHFIAGIPQVVPVAWLAHPMLARVIQQGKASVKYL